MSIWLLIFTLVAFLLGAYIYTWSSKDRKYVTSRSVASAYDNWTNDALLERLWGDHIHLGYYQKRFSKKDFREAKVDFVHELIRWSGLDQLPRGSQIIDIGCGIGGSARILAKDYGFDVLGISISPEQIRRAKELTPSDLSCQFEVMDALDLKIENGFFDGVWSVEAGPHMVDKKRYADEMLRVLRPGGVLAVADWNIRDPINGKMNHLERGVMHHLLDQWAHPEFSSMNGFKKSLLDSRFCGGPVEMADWTVFTIPSWLDSVFEGIRRPHAIIGLGPAAFFKGLREIPTILLMHWAFAKGLMKFGVFRSRG